MRITDSQQIVITAIPKTKPGPTGKPAPIEPGSAMWAFPPFVANNPSPDGLSTTAVAVGIGEDIYSFSCDADLGAGVVTISASKECVVTANPASVVEFEEGVPTEQVEAGPEPNPVP